MVFFCNAARQVQDLFPVLFDQPAKQPKDERGDLQKAVSKRFYWEIVENEAAKVGIFNINGCSPKESIQKTKAFDVLKYMNLQAAING